MTSEARAASSPKLKAGAVSMAQPVAESHRELKPLPPNPFSSTKFGDAPRVMITGAR